MSGPISNVPPGDEKRAVLAVDCSTTAVKALVIDAQGHTLAAARRLLTTTSPEPGWFEQQPDSWLEALHGAASEAVRASGVGDQLRSISITHQRETFVCVDPDGTALRPAILWMDARATEQVQRHGTDRVEDLSGKPADVTPAFYKMAWLHEHEPETLGGAHKVVDVHGFLVWHLTGQWVTSSASADPLGIVDIRRSCYSEELLDIVSVRRDQLASLVDPGSVIGPIRPEIAATWGVEHPLQLIAGCGDGQAAGLGADATQTHVAYLNLGTAVVTGVHSETCRPGRAYRTMVSGLPDRYALEAFLTSGAHLVSWFHGAFGNPGKDGSLDPQLDRDISGLPNGSDGLLVLPYWNGAQSPYWDPSARGAIIGWRSHHTRAHVYLAILEGICLEVRLHVETLQEATGVPITELRAMGGGSRSRTWVQLAADILQLPIAVCIEDETSALGAGVLAMPIADGAEADQRLTLAGRMSNVASPVQPRTRSAEYYDALFATYRTLYPTLQSASRALGASAHSYPGELGEQITIPGAPSA